MFRTIVVTLGLVLLVPLTLLAQDGKIRGTVTDKETGEALIGANVLIEGTALGAATDVNGEYVILSVPPGTYTLRVTFVGYASFAISNVRVSSNITTTQDIALVSSAVQLQGVEIVADRPLIQRNTTNTIRLTTQEDIENLPIREVGNLLALQAGVVRQDGDLYVRGGREGEVAYFLDGAGTTNPVYNSQSVGIIQEAIEELQLQAGGYTAEFGGSNSAIVRTTLRTGGSAFKASVDILSDDFAKPGEEFLGTSSFGFRNAVLTLSGPITNDIRFFVAGQHNFVRNRQIIYLEPFKFENILSDVNDPRGAGQPLPGPIEFKRNYIPNNWFERNTGQGTLTFDVQPVKFRLTGTYEAIRAPFNGGVTGFDAGNISPARRVDVVSPRSLAGGWPAALTNMFNQRRTRMDHDNTGFASLRATHVLGAKTFYEIGVSWQNRNFRREDPDFGADWMNYVDSVKNAAIGYTGWTSRFQGPQPYSVIDGFRFAHENAPNNAYSKSHQSSIGVTADITTQLESNVELKAGGRIESWKARQYSVGNIQGAMQFLYPDGVNLRSFANADQRRALLGRAGTINHFGYDVDGKEVDSGTDGPRKPFFASAYVQSKLEQHDHVLNVGFRLEHFDTKTKTFADPLNPPFIDTLDVIDESRLVDQDPFTLVLPRVSFSFPVTDNTVFYAMYGRYAQMPSLNQLYVGNTTLSRTVSVSTRGNAFLTPVGFLMKPERTTQYELGFRQSVTDNFAITMTGFYKDIKDQLQVRSFVSPSGTKVFTAYLNEDFGTVKGLETTFELRRVNRLAAKLTYTLSDAQGTGSNPRAAFGAIEQNIGRPTNFINPLDHNQTHRGTLLLDYRFGKDDGGALEGLGLNFLISFNSGHNYTKIKEPQELGQANSWNVGIRPLIDTRSSFPVEPVNASKTPWVFNVDMNLSKTFYLGDFNLEIYANVLNLFDSKQIINVYPSTGTAQDDGWLGSPLAASFSSIPNYVEFYRAINLQNRWAYATATGNDLFGAPRQIRLGMRLEI